jgi:hypothetical protein
MCNSKVTLEANVSGLVSVVEGLVFVAGSPLIHDPFLLNQTFLVVVSNAIPILSPVVNEYPEPELTSVAPR